MEQRIDGIDEFDEDGLDTEVVKQMFKESGWFSYEYFLRGFWIASRRRGPGAAREIAELSKLDRDLEWQSYGITRNEQ